MLLGEKYETFTTKLIYLGIEIDTKLMELLSQMISFKG